MDILDIEGSVIKRIMINKWCYKIVRILYYNKCDHNTITTGYKNWISIIVLHVLYSCVAYEIISLVNKYGK